MPKTLTSEDIREIMNKVTSKSVSSHDIIPRSQLPALYEYQIDYIREQFGNLNIDTYLEHARYSHRIKTLILKMTHHRIQLGKIYQLAITIYAMGVAECQSLVTALHHELLKADFSEFSSATIYNLQTNKGHCFLVIGNCELNIQAPFPSCLSSLPKEILIADPLLSYLGPACDYVATHQDYFSRYRYQTLVGYEKANKDYLEQILNSERLAHQWVDELKLLHQIERFYDKSLIPLAKSGYPCLGKKITHETALLQSLKKTGLQFFGLSSPEYKVDAVCEINNQIDILRARGIQEKLKTGRKYQNSEGQTFFVISEINYHPELSHQISRL